MHSILENVAGIAHTSKVGQVIAGASPALVGVAEKASWLSENIAEIGIFLGGIASITVIVSNLVKIYLDLKRYKKESNQDLEKDDN